MALPLALWIWWRAVTMPPVFEAPREKRPINPEEETDTQDAS